MNEPLDLQNVFNTFRQQINLNMQKGIGYSTSGYIISMLLAVFSSQGYIYMCRGGTCFKQGDVGIFPSFRAVPLVHISCLSFSDDYLLVEVGSFFWRGSNIAV